MQIPVDRGQAYVTSQRVVFTGARATREWLFAKLVGADASSDDHLVLLHVSEPEEGFRPIARTGRVSVPGLPGRGG